MKIVVCGCTKDSEKYIRNHIFKLYTIKNISDQFKIIVYENDSTDSTLSILKETLEIDHVISEQLSFKKDRIKTLCHARNRLLEYVLKNYKFYDLMIMVDLDDVISEFNYKILENVFSKYKLSDWDVLTSNNYGVYYDIYALRTGPNHIWTNGMNYDCWYTINSQRKQIELLSGGKITRSEYIELLYRHIKDYQKKISQDDQLIPVHSAFGGMAVYKIRILDQNTKYNCNDGCEHVGFHKSITNKGGKIFICPILLTLGEKRNEITL